MTRPTKKLQVVTLIKQIRPLHRRNQMMQLLRRTHPTQTPTTRTIRILRQHLLAQIPPPRPTILQVNTRNFLTRQMLGLHPKRHNSTPNPHTSPNTTRTTRAHIFPNTLLTKLGDTLGTHNTSPIKDAPTQIFLPNLTHHKRIRTSRPDPRNITTNIAANQQRRTIEINRQQHLRHFEIPHHTSPIQ